jgi:hypothetical protein
MEQLVEYLHYLASNETAYNEYLKYKELEDWGSYAKLLARKKYDARCEICLLANSLKDMLYQDDLMESKEEKDLWPWTGAEKAWWEQKGKEEGKPLEMEYEYDEAKAHEEPPFGLFSRRRALEEEEEVRLP